MAQVIALAVVLTGAYLTYGSLRDAMGAQRWAAPYAHASTNKSAAALNCLVLLAGVASAVLVVDPDSELASLAEWCFGVAAAAVGLVAVAMLTPLTPTSNRLATAAHIRAVRKEVARQTKAVARWIDDDHDGTVSRRELDRLRLATGWDKSQFGDLVHVDADELMDDKAWAEYCQYLGVSSTEQAITIADMNERTVLKMYKAIFGDDGVALDPERLNTKLHHARHEFEQQQIKQRRVQDQTTVAQWIDAQPEGVLSREEYERITTEPLAERAWEEVCAKAGAEANDSAGGLTGAQCAQLQGADPRAFAAILEVATTASERVAE